MNFWTTLKRIARYGFVGFMRNGFVSLAAVLIMTITLFVLATLLISGAALNSVLKDLTSKVDVTVYFTTSATQDQIAQVESSLKALPEVASVTEVSADQALAQFQARNANNQLIMQSLQVLGGNPLGPSLQIQAKQTSQYPAIAQYLSAQQSSGNSPGNAIDTVDYFQ